MRGEPEVKAMRRITLILAAVALAAQPAVACSGTTAQPEATVGYPAAPADTVAAPSPAPTATTETTATAEPTAEPTATAEPPTAKPTATAEPAPTEEPTAEPTATEPPTAAPAPERAAVTIDDFLFSPGSITVRVGSTVTWTHVGNARHTVTADDGSFDSGSLSGGGTFDFTFSAAGTYAYYCRLHGAPGQEGMSAVITVTE